MNADDWYDNHKSVMRIILRIHNLNERHVAAFLIRMGMCETHIIKANYHEC